MLQHQAFAKENMRFPLPALRKESIKELQERRFEDIIKRIDKKGRPLQAVQGKHARLLREMSNLDNNNNNSSLFVRDLRLANRLKEAMNRNEGKLNCYANMFLVDKSSFDEDLQEYLKRIIIDCRATNAMLDNGVVHHRHVSAAHHPLSQSPTLRWSHVRTINGSATLVPSDSIPRTLPQLRQSQSRRPRRFHLPQMLANGISHVPRNRPGVHMVTAAVERGEE